MHVSGFAPDVRVAAFDANLGRCAGCHRPATDVHHRRPRGSGGSSDPVTGSQANTLAACRSCHSWAESHRDEARRIGWLVPAGVDPVSVPWWSSQWGSYMRWVEHVDVHRGRECRTWLVEFVPPKGAD